MNGVELAKFIDEEIQARGLKKKTFYLATGITSATLSQWRTGTYNPSVENVEAVEKFFDVSFSFSIETKKDPSAITDEEADEEKNSSAHEDAELDADTLLILDLLGKLTPSNLDRALAYLQGLVAGQS